MSQTGSMGLGRSSDILPSRVPSPAHRSIARVMPARVYLMPMRILVVLALLAGCGSDRLARDPATVAAPWAHDRSSVYRYVVGGGRDKLGDSPYAPGAEDGILLHHQAEEASDPEAAA